MFLLAIGFAVVLMVLCRYSSERSRGLLLRLLSKIMMLNSVTTLFAIAIGTTLTTHFRSRVRSYQPSHDDSVWSNIYFALPFLETRDSSNSEWYTALAASLATSLGWNIFSFERWQFNIIIQLIMGTSFGMNAGIAAGMTDTPSAGCTAFGAAAIVTASLPILNLTLNLFVNWITEQVINKIQNCFYEYLRNLCRQTGESMMSQARSAYAFLFEEAPVQPQEAQEDDDIPPFDVVTIVAITGSTLLGGFFGNGHVVTYVPFFNIELVYTGWKSFVLSAVVAVATIIGMRIPLFSIWTPLRSLAGVFIGISLGTSVGMLIGQLQMKTVVFIASGVSLAITTAVVLRRAIFT